MDNVVSTKASPAQRDDYYARIAPNHLAPLWMRLKSLVPAVPAPEAVAYRWGYEETRPYLMEAASLITAEEAERRVLILENPGLSGSSRVGRAAVRRITTHHAGRGRALASPHSVGVALCARRAGRLHRGRRRADSDVARRFRHHASVDLASPRQRLQRSDGVARRARHSVGRAFRRDLPRKSFRSHSSCASAGQGIRSPATGWGCFPSTTNRHRRIRPSSTIRTRALAKHCTRWRKEALPIRIKAI